MFRCFLSNFFATSQEPTQPRVPPVRADGKPMKGEEKQVWGMMQKALGEYLERNTKTGVYTLGQGDRGVIVGVVGPSQIWCVCASGHWASAYKDGVVGIPRKINA